MKKTTVYKAVLPNNKSIYALEFICLKYEIGKTTYPKEGFIFAFDSVENVIEYFGDFLETLKVYECEAEIATPGTSQKFIRFWRKDTSDQGLEMLPRGTVLCENVTPKRLLRVLPKLQSRLERYVYAITQNEFRFRISKETRPRFGFIFAFDNMGAVEKHCGALIEEVFVYYCEAIVANIRKNSMPLASWDGEDNWLIPVENTFYDMEAEGIVICRSITPVCFVAGKKRRFF